MGNCASFLLEESPLVLSCPIKKAPNFHLLIIYVIQMEQLRLTINEMAMTENTLNVLIKFVKKILSRLLTRGCNKYIPKE